MSFNSVTLIIATIIFVILLGMVAFFIYQGQKSKFTMVQSTCPDYWTLTTNKDATTKNPTYTCSPPPGDVNMGDCTSTSPPPNYTSKSSLKSSCSIYADKLNFTQQNCKGNGGILWDGVTNNASLRTSCKL